MIKLPKTFLRGSYPPIITPFRNGEVDYKTFAKLVEFQVKNGSHGILVTGTTSEPATLSVDERKKLLETALEVNQGRKPVVAATGSQSYADTSALVTHATEAGADALLVVTPYYIQPPQRGLVAYYTALGDLTDKPMMIYHIPGRAGVSVTLDTFDQICSNVPNMVGMKHASPDLAFVTSCIAHFGKDFRIFVGLEHLSYPMMAVGACGLMNAVGNLLPRKMAKLCDLIFDGNMAAAKKLHYEVAELNDSVFFDTNPIAIKYMMKKLKIIPRNEHRLPMVPATKELEGRLNGVLKRAGMI